VEEQDENEERQLREAQDDPAVAGGEADWEGKLFSKELWSCQASKWTTIPKNNITKTPPSLYDPDLLRLYPSRSSLQTPQMGVYGQMNIVKKDSRETEC
jgi:hypothetical protein